MFSAHIFFCEKNYGVRSSELTLLEAENGLSFKQGQNSLKITEL